MAARTRAGETSKGANNAYGAYSYSILAIRPRQYGYGPCGSIQATSASMGMRMPSRRSLLQPWPLQGALTTAPPTVRGRATAWLDSINPSGPK